jgi:uncharacterized membrane protein YhaH (DUF805 family)
MALLASFRAQDSGRMTQTTVPGALPPTLTFPQAITTVFSKYVDFSGRASRSEFWYFVLFSTIVSTALGALNLVTPEGVIPIGNSLASVWSIIVLLPSLGVAVRRLRDAGFQWTQLFWLLLPLVGLIVLVVRWCEPSRPTA